MNPYQQITEMEARHVQDGRWCRCGQEYPCDAVILLRTYITPPYVLTAQRIYGMGFDTALDFVTKYASRPDQFIAARSIVRAVNEVRSLRDRSYPPDPNEQIVRESTADMGRTLDAFIESGESAHGGIWGHGRAYSERADAHGTHYRATDRPLSEEMLGTPIERYVPESEFSQSATPVCSKHGTEMQRAENIVDDYCVHFRCPVVGCDKWMRVQR